MCAEQWKEGVSAMRKRTDVKLEPVFIEFIGPKINKNSFQGVGKN